MAFLSVFFGTVLCFVGATEAFVRWRVAPDDGFERYKQLFHTSRAPAVAFGDSHVANDIVASDYLANLGYRGDSGATMLNKLDAYLASKRPKGVVLQVDPHQFSFYRLALDQGARLDYLLDREVGALQMLRPQFRENLFAYWMAVLKNPRRLFPAKQAEAAQPRDIVRASELPADEFQRTTAIRVQLHVPVEGVAATSVAARLNKAIGRLKRDRIALCLVTYPVSETYRAVAEKFPQFAVVREYIAGLATSKDVRYVDFWDAYDDDLFGDPDHLNRDGAMRFTQDVLDACFPESTE